MPHHDFLITGAGIFGITTAIELCRRGHSVGILNPGKIPHPLAASTDISKVVRMEYGADLQYFEMAEESIAGWERWNEQFGEQLFHKTGFLLLCKQPMEHDSQSFERESFRMLLQKNYQPERFDAAELTRRFPALGSGQYTEGFFNPVAGYAESGKVVESLTALARQLGVQVFESQTAVRLNGSGGRVESVGTREGAIFTAGHIVVCAGAWTSLLVPELQPFMQATGHPVFHVKPRRPELFSEPELPVFAADISNSGWYGFPLHPGEGVVKIGNHGPGLPLHPELDERVVTGADERHFHHFLKEIFPALADDPVVFTRRCLYCDTLDGHFLIDRHPEKSNLTVGTGGSGHAFKMAPLLGRLVATAAEGGDEKWLSRFRWRNLSGQSANEEKARFSGK